MPTAEEFKDGFDLRKGLKCGDFHLISVHLTEKSIVRFNEYAYPMKLVFQKNDKHEVKESDVGALLITLEEQFGGTRIIRSGSGRPYACELQDPQKGEPKWAIEKESVVLELTGHGRRVKEAVASEIEEDSE